MPRFAELRTDPYRESRATAATQRIRVHGRSPGTINGSRTALARHDANGSARRCSVQSLAYMPRLDIAAERRDVRLFDTMRRASNKAENPPDRAPGDKQMASAATGAFASCARTK